jgi:hypothetical protein
MTKLPLRIVVLGVAVLAVVALRSSDGDAAPPPAAPTNGATARPPPPPPPSPPPPTPTYIILPFTKGSVNISVGQTVKTSCKGDVNTIYRCEGGKCAEASSYSCVPFTCAKDGLGCTSTCSTASDCGQGAECNSSRGECTSYFGTCVTPFIGKSPNGQLFPCSPYRCVAGNCQGQCVTAADCDSGYTCTQYANGSYFYCKKTGG